VFSPLKQFVSPLEQIASPWNNLMPELEDKLEWGLLYELASRHVCPEVGRLSDLEFCYSVYIQYESFIYLNLMVKNREVSIKRYFKRWTNIKLVYGTGTKLLIY
jgi:hypothetical protein